MLAIPPDLTTALERAFVAATAWTGGGEIELIRDATGRLWLMEINPRFPAWIFGATLAGVNLPALLVAAELGVARCPRSRRASEFTRLVVQAPIQNEVTALLKVHAPLEVRAMISAPAQCGEPDASGRAAPGRGCTREAR